MTNKRVKNKKISLWIAILVAIISIVGIVINISFLSISLVNKPITTEHLCAPASYGSDGVIYEADLGCMVRDQRALKDWTTSNYVYCILISLLIGVLVADGIMTYKMFKKTNTSNLIVTKYIH